MFLLATSWLISSWSFQIFDSTSLAVERFQPQIESVFIPAGMVASDPLQITVEYRLKNSCERLARTNVFPHEEHRRVLQLVSEAYREPREDCQDGNFIRKVRVPLGPLPVGSYELRNYHRLAQRFGKLEVKVVDEDSVLEHRLAFSYDPILR